MVKIETKKLIAMAALLFLLSEFFVNFAFAQTNGTTTSMTTTTTTPAISLPQVPASLKDVYNLFSSINPFFLLVIGLVLLVLSHLGKYIAVILIVFAVIQIILLLIH